MSTSTPKSPPDPDPTPRAASDSSEQVAKADRQERKRAARQYGRQQTILAAGNSAPVAENKKTVLGG